MIKDFVNGLHTLKEMFMKKTKSKDIWKYTCENVHKWEDTKSPGGGIFAPESRCPECYTTICKADRYVNGEFAGGAIHTDFKRKQ